MYTLVFDTTASGIAVALYKDRTQMKKVEKMMEFGQAEALAVDVKKIIDDANISFDEIGLLGVCSGPGSFTGVRAGLAFARGLALGNTNLQITGVSAFDAYVRMIKPENRAFYNAVVIETKRDDYYFQLFDEKLRKISEPMALERDEIIQRLKGHQTSFVGDGVERLLSVSSGLQIKSVEITDMMSVEALFEGTYQKFLEKTLDFPKPLYIRGVSACAK